ncbi:MAG: hypothetical protein DSY47_02730 [Hydrogenothermus sp.]|nr:MAG: hypothetical protein DSY47_02730 [Hydrogenothermus sp.]
MNQNASFFREILKKVYDDFYYRLISDPYFAEFFRNKNSEDIKSKQIENLIRNYNKFIKGNLEEVKQNYIQLAKLHDELGLDFNSYMDSLSDLEILILKEFFHFYKQNQLKDLDIEYVFINFEDFFDLIRKYSAAGYLDNLVHREKKIMDEFIEANIDYKLYEVKDLVDTHLDWKEDILDFLIDEKDIDENIISVYSCKATSWLDDKLREEKSKEKREKLKKLQELHYNLHKSAGKLVNLKKEEKLFQLVYEYNNFVKTSLIFLSSIIAYTTSQQIKNLQRDPLTHLLSRRLLKEIFLNVMDLSILSGEPFAVAFIDIDNFKEINDRYGHLIGDEVLKALAKALKEELRGSDYIFRYGGEEFVLILPSVKSLSDLFNILEKIRKKVENISLKVDSKEIRFTVSIGAVLIKENKRAPLEKVIEQADELMYYAKKTGKNKVIVELFKI